MADYTLSGDIIGAKELTDAIKGVSEVAQKAIKDAVNKTAIQIEVKARDKAPHKTGALWGSIHTAQEPGNMARVEGDNIVARVGTNLEYARAQEKGTVGMVIKVPNGRRTRNGGMTRPYTFRGNIKPKYYMKQAKEEVAPDYVENMKEAMTIIVTHLAQ